MSGGSAITVNGGALSGAASGSIGGASTLTVSSGGLATLSGSNNYTGATAVNSGTLQLGSGGSLAGTAVTVGGTGQCHPFRRRQLHHRHERHGGPDSHRRPPALSRLWMAAPIPSQSAAATASLPLAADDNINLEVSGATADEIVLSGSGHTASVTGTNTINLTPAGAYLHRHRYPDQRPGWQPCHRRHILSLTRERSGHVEPAGDEHNHPSCHVANATPATAYFTGSLSSAWNTVSGADWPISAPTALARHNACQLPGSTTNVHFYATSNTAARI